MCAARVASMCARSVDEKQLFNGASICFSRNTSSASSVLRIHDCFASYDDRFVSMEEFVVSAGDAAPGVCVWMSFYQAQFMCELKVHRIICLRNRALYKVQSRNNENLINFWLFVKNHLVRDSNFRPTDCDMSLLSLTFYWIVGHLCGSSCCWYGCRFLGVRFCLEKQEESC